MVMNMIIRIREKGFSSEFMKQDVVNMTCETAIDWCAILGPKLGSIECTEMRVQLGRLVSLGEEHKYRSGLELNRIFKTRLREGLERGLIVPRHATIAIEIDSRQTIPQSLDRWKRSLERRKILLEKGGMDASSLERRTQPRSHEEEIVSKVTKL